MKLKLTKVLKVEMEAAVLRGVKFLDKHNPEWFTRINLNTLDLEKPNFCILGQCYGSFWDALSGALRGPRGRTNQWAIRHGFNALNATDDDGVVNGSYEYLTFAWVPYIAVRQVRRARTLQAAVQ